MSKMIFKLGKRAAATLAGTLLSLSVSAQEIPLDRVVAIVNDGIVLQSELNTRINLVRDQLQQRSTQMPQYDILRKQVLERLILDSLQLQLAEQRGIRVSDRQLAMALENIARQNNLTLDQFREAVIAEGQNFDTFREQIRRELMITQVQRSVVNSRIRVTEQDLRNYLESEEGKASSNAEYNLSNILLAVPTQATPAMIQDAQQKAAQLYEDLKAGEDFAQAAISYSNAPNALKGGELGWRKINELPVQLSNALKNQPVGTLTPPIRTPGGFHILKVNGKRGGDTVLIEQTKVRHILLKPTEIRNAEQSRLKIYELAERLRQGEDFAQLAREYSDDPGSGSEGGSLGWTQDGQMVPEFEQTMNATPVGELSEPFRTQFGWHILQVEGRRTQDVGEKVIENQARNSIRKRRFNEELENWLREIHSQAYIEIKE
ncbi:peptidylprolyl isomerase [Pontibacterium granulatum]|uniref:peptidylprolyl isomerase n=1 Tax=Pontibacterium granulatum TaxID=2036029 RepID=UPI00249AE22E|nr:peptidylprolyl isomerase [Pontibacterium granulatum]MDI3322826.1 peptidylprolyl isomerase [Pontibacterium granulatum]